MGESPPLSFGSRQHRGDNAMPDIKFVRKHALSVAQAKKIAQKAADDLAEEYNLESEWDGNTLNFARSGVNGEMDVTASEIRLEVNLGFLLKPFKFRFEQHISHRLDELLLAAGSAKKSGEKGAKTAKAGAKRKA
jgi:putative polyhydroxyalkanoate system protein